MSSNYNINKEKVINDYYKCIGAFKNCENIYKNKSTFTIKDNDPEEIKLIKKGMQEDLLSNLGKIGEKAFKYIIGLENLKISPNQDENTFESLWKKTNTRKDFILKHGVSERNPKLNKIMNYVDENNQLAHNFDYWYSIIELSMQPISQKFRKFISYNIQTRILVNYCEKNDEFKYYRIYNDTDIEELSLPFRAALFPNLINLQYDNVPALKEELVNKILNYQRITLKNSGDIFTRLRYASNNKSNEEFDVKEVYELIYMVVEFIKMIHENNDNLDFDLDKTYAKKQALKYKEYLNISEDEINNLFSLDIKGTDLALTVFETNYSYNSIKNLLEIGVSKEDLRKVMREGLSSRVVKNFFDKGIRDYRKMRKIIDNYINESNDYFEDQNDYTYKKF